MAKPLATSDVAKNNSKIAQLLRASLPDSDPGKKQMLLEETAEFEPATWAENKPASDPQLLSFPAKAVAETPSAETKNSNSSQLQIDALRAENARLRTALREMESAVEELEQTSSGSPAGQLRDLQEVIEQKDTLIREMHQRLHGGNAVEAAADTGGAIVAREREEELLALSEELERERRQLKEDEDGLMRQMRDMEIQMSRERAEMARQRNELTRLHNELRHELELAARDAGLRERLAPLQRRHRDIIARRSGPMPIAEHQQLQPAPEPPTQSKDAGSSSGIFRRLFGGK